MRASQQLVMTPSLKWTSSKLAAHHRNENKSKWPGISHSARGLACRNQCCEPSWQPSSFRSLSSLLDVMCSHPSGIQLIMLKTHSGSANCGNFCTWWSFHGYRFTAHRPKIIVRFRSQVTYCFWRSFLQINRAHFQICRLLGGTSGNFPYWPYNLIKKLWYSSWVCQHYVFFVILRVLLEWSLYGMPTLTKIRHSNVSSL